MASNSSKENIKADAVLEVEKLEIKVGVVFNVDSSGQESYERVLQNGVAHMLGTTLPGSGNGNGQFDFGDATITGPYDGKNAVIIVKYDSIGIVQWVKSADEASDSSEFYGVANDNSNYVYSTGFITGLNYFDFGSDAIVSGGADENSVIIKYEDSSDDQGTPIVDTTAPKFSSFGSESKKINIANGQHITINPFVIRVKPTDGDSGIKKVKFYIDGKLICVDKNANGNGVYACGWNTAKYHSKVKVTAFDNSNNSTSITREMTVDPMLYLKVLLITGR